MNPSKVFVPCAMIHGPCVVKIIGEKAEDNLFLVEGNENVEDRWHPRGEFVELLIPEEALRILTEVRGKQAIWQRAKGLFKPKRQI